MPIELTCPQCGEVFARTMLLWHSPATEYGKMLKQASIKCPRCGALLDPSNFEIEIVKNPYAGNVDRHN